MMTGWLFARDDTVSLEMGVLSTSEKQIRDQKQVAQMSFLCNSRHTWQLFKIPIYCLN